MVLTLFTRGAYLIFRVSYDHAYERSILKPGFHMIAPVATIATVVEKRVSATVAIYGNTLFSNSDRSDSSDEHRSDRKIFISAMVATGATVYFFKWKPHNILVATVATKMPSRSALHTLKTSGRATRHQYLFTHSSKCCPVEK